MSATGSTYLHACSLTCSTHMLAQVYNSMSWHWCISLSIRFPWKKKQHHSINCCSKYFCFFPDFVHAHATSLPWARNICQIFWSISEWQHHTGTADLSIVHPGCKSTLPPHPEGLTGIWWLWRPLSAVNSLSRSWYELCGMLSYPAGSSQQDNSERDGRGQQQTRVAFDV